jgi:hypothetical protein
MTNVTNYNLNRRIRQTLYVLKRAFGSTVTLHKLVTASTSYTTGTKTSSSTSISIPRCIVLPVKVQRDVIATISGMSTNKTFSGMGGYVDTGLREFVIDARDLPTGYDICLEDWLAYDDHRYEFKNIERLEQHTGWHITGKMVVSATTAKTTQVTQTLNFTESLDNE